MTDNDADEFKAWAGRALHGLRASAIHMVLAPEKWADSDHYAFMLQIGFSICNSKPILILCPRGRDIPPKLRAVADAVAEYDPDDQNDMKRATLAAFRKVGIEPKH